MKNIFRFLLKLGLLASLISISPAARAQNNAAGYALSFNGSNNYVSLSLTSPPASNYTLSAWVYLRTGGTFGGQRAAVLGGQGCGDSIEFMIRANTEDPSDPQYLELGRCSAFNGYNSTTAVPLNTWTPVTVTVSATQTVSYFVNGVAAGTWDGTGLDLSLGTAVNLGDNNGTRFFDGVLTDVQIWNRVLSQSEIQTYTSQEPAEDASGLYAFYPFNEGSGATTADLAAAAGGSTGVLVNNPAWVPLVLLVTNTADSGPGSLRDAIAAALPGATIQFAGSLCGQTITLTSGQLALNQNLTIDASALPGGIAINGNQNGNVFAVAGGATNVLIALTITNGSTAGGGGGIDNDGTLTVNQCTLTGNTAAEGGGIFNWGNTLTMNQCTLTGNSASDSGGGIFNYVGTLNVNQCTVTGNSAGSNYFAGGGGINNYAGAMTLTNTIVAGNVNAYSGNLFGSFSGSDNLTNGNPLLAPLGNYGGPTPTMPPLPGSPAIDGCTNGTSFATDQRGFPRIVGPYADIGAVEGVFNPAGREP